MGVAKEHRFAVLNRAIFDTPLDETCVVEVRHWERINTELTRAKEENAALVAALKRARVAFRALECSRTMERAAAVERAEADHKAYLFVCECLEKSRKNVNTLAVKLARALKLIRYTMSPTEYHRSMSTLFDDHVSPYEKESA